MISYYVSSTAICLLLLQLTIGLLLCYFLIGENTPRTIGLIYRV